MTNREIKSACVTPKSRKSPWMRINNGVHGISRITSYFPIRKRGCQDSLDVGGKRRRRSTTVCDAEFLSPGETYQGISPLHFGSLKVQDEVESDTQEAILHDAVPCITPLGVFEELPPSLFHFMFDNIDVPCLVSLCLTSSSWNDQLFNYVNSNLFLQRVQRESRSFAMSECLHKKDYFTIMDPFYCYGKLLKSVSVCFSTSKRISLLMSFCNRALVYDGIDKSGVGRVVHSMCSKWAFSECAKVLEAILEMGNGRLKDALKLLSDNEPESLPKIELELRNTIRPLLLSGRDARYEGADIEYIFWLSAVLRTLKDPISQSKLLMVLFGPTTTRQSETIIDWRLFCEHVIAPLDLAETVVKPLSDVLYLLLKTKLLNNEEYFWSQHDVFNVIEELSTAPEPWSFDNFVILLLHRPALIPVSLIARMNHNYTEEACLMFLSFMTTSYRWNMNVSEVIEQPILQTMRALTRERGREFFDNICDLYVHQLKELSSRGQEGAQDLRILMAAHAEIAPLMQEMSTVLW